MDSYWVQRYEIWDQSPVDTSQTGRTLKAALKCLSYTKKYIYTCIQNLHQLMYSLFSKYKCMRLNAVVSASTQIPFFADKTEYKTTEFIYILHILQVRTRTQKKYNTIQYKYEMHHLYSRL